MYTELLKERDSIPALPVFPGSYNGANAASGFINMALFNRAEFFLMIGQQVAGASVVNAWLVESNFANGASPTNIASCAITALASSTVNTVCSLEVTAQQITKQFVGCVANIASFGTNIAILPVGTDARYKPANNNDVANVAQRVYVTPS